MDRLKELRIDRQEKAPQPSGGSRWPLVLLLLLVGAAIFWFFGRRQGVPEVRLATVRSVSASAALAESSVLDASGYVTARLQATVSSKVTGKIVEVLVEEGMEVEEGQLLARLDDSIVKRQLALAVAQEKAAASTLAEIEVRLRKAELDRERSERLVEAKVATQAQLDSDIAERDALEARLASAREDLLVAGEAVELRRQELRDTEIRAPFSGVAVSKNAQPGEMISPISAGGGFTRTGVCTLVDMSSLEIVVDVNEAYIGRVRSDMPVTATLDAYPSWHIPASVITTVPTADRQKATVEVRIAFDALDPRILPDMGVKVSFLEEEPEVAESGEEQAKILVPASAVSREGENAVVFVLDGDTVERRAVKVEGEGDELEVLAGLQDGERVVVSGHESLADGDEVRVAQ
jgi:RND family efflux transporter MFP subunit